MQRYGFHDAPPPSFDDKPWWIAISLIVGGIITLITYQHIIGLYP